MERRLAAILAADVVGYSRLMAADEGGSLARFKLLRSDHLEPAIRAHGGRVVGEAGDSLLVEFGTATQAVACAVEVQAKLAELNAELPEDRRMRFRMGVNLGEVIVDGATIHGDGVNIAARLEKLAEPGGIIIARGVHDQIKGKAPYRLEDLGEKVLHNIEEPIRVYRVTVPDSVVASGESLSLPDKPSIAVLPFTNMSGDPDQEYFADGMVEEIITALSRMRWLFVIARNSSFTYKGRAVDVKQVGRELGVRYVLEGGVRKAGNRVRITGQLIDTATGAHLWADRFEGELEDIFDLQDRVTASVVGAIAPKLEQAEIERAQRKPTDSLDAYDCFLRGMAGVHRWTREANEEALSYFYRAIEIDPNFAAAYGMAARCYVQRKAGGWVTDRAHEVAEASRLARRAADLGRNDAVALSTAGMALADVAGNLEDGAALIDRALAIDPNSALAWLFSGWVKVWLGDPDSAIERVARALRLSPQDPQTISMLTAIANAHFVAGRHDEAFSWAETAAREQTDVFYPMVLAAASGALSGRLTEARKAMERLRELNPGLRISNLADQFPDRPDGLAKWANGLRLAGLPE